MTEKLKISLPILVEGRYDRCRLETVVQARILCTDGFGVFKDKEKSQMLRKIAKAAGKIIVLTDSDGAGLVIRNHINSILPKEQIIHVYIPQIEGKEKRKATASKEGYLGVEGMENDLLYQLLLPYADGKEPKAQMLLTKADMFADGLNGTPDSTTRRQALAKMMGLPEQLSANALLSALNLLLDEKEYRETLDRLNQQFPKTVNG